MTKKSQIKGFEETINNIPLCIDPCKICKHNKNKGNDDFLPNYDVQTCRECCWFYDSMFKESV